MLSLLRYVFPNFVRSVTISSKNLANVYMNQPIKSGEYWDGNKSIPSSDESYDETREDELWQYLEGLDE
ncbi:hypothetical protein AYR62_15395 [Secundilactobacillus paracollinoides]|uniref:Uncharacterized protein n=1 Tax=Secundilactobacillus paracollinoides TaxID=240427 RepID=A0A1B2IVX9_9LACO|nr:hypothetical protein [Secundilactobacillus paracollinoides]ANZ60395.1 hypothetical protein AYR61_02880 [Secundilactobacillus paracollinoides]ANZ65324.1 hypothetical protein AYR62_15395 [Secundilactobacillus paracollinoides]ANZ66224.1 hypothetical protein AYR63_03085 [Secundilactobacillus paracollinoides]